MVRRSGGKVEALARKIIRGTRSKGERQGRDRVHGQRTWVILIKTVVRKKRRAGSAFAWKIMFGTRINITLYCSLPTIDTNGRD